jgi:DNA (cytosine-5)-methyltransferase 1
MRHGSLFSGIGGFDLAAEWMGWENIFHCEWNHFGQKVLKHYWPNSISYNDITQTDFSIHRGKIDILTGGFPCQPYSTAGKRLGKADERHLFPEMLRCIKEIKPRWIIGENVRGLVSWNGGMVFNEVCDDLEREGYEVQPFLIPAASVNAPHRRDRIWFVANNVADTLPIRLQQCENRNEMGRGQGEMERKGSKSSDAFKTNDEIQYAADTKSKRYESFNENRTEIFSTSEKQKLYGRSSNRFNKSTKWQNFPSVSAICNGNDGISDRLDSITFPKWRTESIKAGGNAIVPQVVYQIFKAIEQYETLLQK